MLSCDSASDGYQVFDSAGVAITRTFDPDHVTNLGHVATWSGSVAPLTVNAGAHEPVQYPAVVDPPPPPPPPPTGEFQWGFCHSVSLHDSSILREYQDAVDMGCNSSRVTFNQLDSDTAKQVGFKKWMVIVEATTGGMASDAANPTRIINFLAKNGANKIILEPINEPTFMAITAEDLGKLQVKWYHAVKVAAKAAGLTEPEIVLSSMGNSPSSMQHLSMMDYARRLVSVGCTVGNGFDRANVHAYADEAYWHIWTPDASGQSVLKILGDPEFYLTEYGKALSGVGGNELAQADSVQAQAKAARAQPKCKGAYVYAISDDAPGVGSNYGMRRHDLSRRPAFDRLRQTIAAG